MTLSWWNYILYIDDTRVWVLSKHGRVAWELGGMGWG